MANRPTDDRSRVESRTPLPSDAVVSFELILRYPPAEQEAIARESARLLEGGRPAGRRGETIAQRTADPADIERVRAFAARSGLTIESVSPAARSIRLAGRADTVGGLFGVTLFERHTGSSSWREYDGEPRVPPELVGIVGPPIGLSTKPVA